MSLLQEAVQDQTAVREAMDVLQTIETELNERFLEKSHIIRGMMVALVARQHLFLLGPAGEAKSGLTRAIAKRIQGGVLFEKLIRALTAEEEIFGPIKLSRIEEDVYERKIDRKLPAAHVAFLDEIWKGSSAVLNGILDIANERQFDNDGIIPVPLQSMFCASNEMPGEDALTALWDRICLRYKVTGLTESGKRKFMTDEMARRRARALGKDVTGGEGTTITLDQLETLQQAALLVDIPAKVMEDLFSILAELDKKGKNLPSTRKMGWIQDLICANAVLEGRTVAMTDDLAILSHVLWDKEEDIRAIGALVMKIANPNLDRAQELGDEAAAAFGRLMEFVNNNKQAPKSQISSKVMEFRAAVNELAPKFDDLENATKGAGRNTKPIEAIRANIRLMWNQALEMNNMGDVKI